MNFFKQLINAMFSSKKEEKQEQQHKESSYVFQIDNDPYEVPAEIEEVKPARKKRTSTNKVTKKTSGKRKK